MNVAPNTVQGWVVQWIDAIDAPPPQPHHNTPWERTAERLAEHPGRWAKIARHRRSGQLAKDIRAGRLPSFAAVARDAGGSFEARVLREFWGTYEVYARFISNSAQSDRQKTELEENSFWNGLTSELLSTKL